MTSLHRMGKEFFTNFSYIHYTWLLRSCDTLQLLTLAIIYLVATLGGRAKETFDELVLFLGQMH